MRKAILTTSILLMAAQVCFAEDLVPATSDDLASFDRQIQQAQQISDHQGNRNIAPKNLMKPKAKKSNFGAIVSAEAKKLKDEPKDERENMGQFVSDQRRKNPTGTNSKERDDHGPKDDQNSSPAIHGHNGGGNGHGNKN